MVRTLRTVRTLVQPIYAPALTSTISVLRHRQMFPIVEKGTPQISYKSAMVQPIFDDIGKSAIIYSIRWEPKCDCSSFFLIGNIIA